MPKRSHSTVAQTGLWMALCFCLLSCTQTHPPTTYPQYLKAADDSRHTVTALDDYIARQDDSYQWEVEASRTIENVDVQVIGLTSQTWLPPEEVDQPQWQHWLIVSKPQQLTRDTALLFINGGKSRESLRGPNETLARIAQRTGAITLELRAVPNQRLEFNGDGKGRKEDDLVAYTWARYLETGDPIWLAQFPMVKATVRAMDTLHTLHGINKFVVAGASKRGWTTWLTGAVDKRVVALVPVVIDVLNMVPSLDNHHAAYGFWSEAIGDYVRHGVIAQRHSVRFQQLAALVDPFAYRTRLTQPKYVINAAGDQFFAPDSSQFYFTELMGPKYLRYVPNADHSLKGSNAFESLEAFFITIIEQRSHPRFHWQRQGKSLVVEVEDPPSQVLLWQAHNPSARDFRKETIGNSWHSTPLKAEADGKTYIAKVPEPEQGWSAYFVELVFEQLGESPADSQQLPLTFTTEVAITPERLPFKNAAVNRSAEALADTASTD